VNALEGLRVVDLSPTRLGAQVSQVLADFGADVVWVEPPAGALLRAAPAFPYLARGKRSLVADLADAADVHAVRQLAEHADIVIETFRPGVAERIGLGYDSLAQRNPGVVYASISGFGRDGPLADVPGYEGVVMAKLGGFELFRRMHDAAHPPFVAVPWCSFPASALALQGVLAALHERQRSGRGQRVETSLVQGFATLDCWNWFVRLVNERFPDAYPGAETFDDDGIPASPMTFMLLIALTADGRWLQFAQVAPHLFAAHLKALGLDWALGHPDWPGLPALETPEQRLEFWTMMLEAARTRTLAEWQAVFDADPNVYAELFRAGPDVLNHPQLVHDGFAVEIEGDARGRVRMPGPLVRMEHTPAIVDRGAPTIGDTALDDVGWSSAPMTPLPTDDDAPLPLQGVTILELAVLYAAPYGTTLLTDLGARVIKVEALAGDPIRGMVGFPEAAGAKVMQGKESICIDTTTAEGLDIVLRLADQADVVLQGWRAGAAERHGLDAKHLLARNPNLVYLHAPGYGDGGPCGHRPAFAPSIAAAGGVVRAAVGNQVPERPDLTIDEIRRHARHLQPGGTVTQAQPDGLAAVGVSVALMLGLVARDRGAGGQSLVSSMLTTVAGAMADFVVDSDDGGARNEPDSALRGLHALYRIYDAADGWVFLAAPQEHEWRRLVHALEDRAELGGDERFRRPEDRRTNDAALIEALEPVFAKADAATWERELLAAGVACVEVSTDPVEMFLQSKDVGHASGWVTEVVHPTFDQHLRLAPVVRFSRSVTQAKAGVLAGSATDSVLGELGFDAAAITDLRARRIVA
jgi:crotonobetainyl-CoA:carnitine CoA-transferase CaiB-like acyl-CoA transferase